MPTSFSLRKHVYKSEIKALPLTNKTTIQNLKWWFKTVPSGNSYKMFYVELLQSARVIVKKRFKLWNQTTQDCFELNGA